MPAVRTIRVRADRVRFPAPRLCFAEVLTKATIIFLALAGGGMEYRQTKNLIEVFCLACRFYLQNVLRQDGYAVFNCHR